MSVNNASLLDSPTIAITDGTPFSLVSKGSSVGSNKLYVPEDSDSTLRRTVSATTTEAKPLASAPGGYTQERVNLGLKQPKALANLNRTVNTIRIEGSFDPETTDAEIRDMRDWAIQMIDGLDDLWTKRNAQ